MNITASNHDNNLAVLPTVLDKDDEDDSREPTTSNVAPVAADGVGRRNGGSGGGRGLRRSTYISMMANDAAEDDLVLRLSRPKVASAPSGESGADFSLRRNSSPATSSTAAPSPSLKSALRVGSSADVLPRRRPRPTTRRRRGATSPSARTSRGHRRPPSSIIRMHRRALRPRRTR